MLRPIFYILSLSPIPDSSQSADRLWPHWKPRRESRGQEHILSDLRSAYSAAWLELLKRELDESTLRKVLRVMPEAILPFVTQPLTLLDFLTTAYKRGGILAALSLKSVFYMMTHHNLDVPDFYAKLYAIIAPEVLSSKHRDEFAIVTEQFLMSNYLPSATVASFVKRISRISLVAPPAALLVLMPLAYNLLYRHQQVRVILERVKQPSYLTCADPFVDTEPDPLRTHAIDSFLWEFDLLADHYAPMVSNLAQVFQNQRFTQAPFDLNEFAGLSYQTIFDAEINRKVKSVPLEFRTKRSLLGDDEEFTSVWNVGPAPMETTDQSGDRI